MELDAGRCYRALQTRDRRFDGRFFVGVTSTGVYCRPVCPARTPKPENVRFFACAAAAEAAGFRPCRRCRPETAPGTPAWSGTSATVARASRLIAGGALDRGGVAALAATLGVGDRQLRRLFVQHLGATPGQVARARRVHTARQLLDATGLPVADVALAAGFGSVRQLNDAIRGTFGEPPTALRAARRGEPAERDAFVARLRYRPPFAWEAVLAFLAARATPGVEAVGDGAYRRTACVAGEPARIVVRHDAGASLLVVRVHGGTLAALPQVVGRVRRLFDLDADPTRIAEHLRRDPRLRPLVDARPGLRVPGAWDAFELAVRAVLGQQLAVRAATTLAGRLAARFGTPVALGPGLERLAPGPAALADAPLEEIGLPRARAETLRALARGVASGALALEAAHDAAGLAARLGALRGVGPWTAAYVAMRALGDPDAFPAGDLRLRTALGNGRGPVPAAEVGRAAEAWRPWRAYAATYLWSAGAAAAAPRNAGGRRAAAGAEGTP